MDFDNSRALVLFSRKDFESAKCNVLISRSKSFSNHKKVDQNHSASVVLIHVSEVQHSTDLK